MKKQKGFTVVEMLVTFAVILGIVALIGWVMNIMHVVHANFDHITGLLLVQVIGIFVPPIGAVAGWFL